MKLFEMYSRAVDGYQDDGADNSAPSLVEVRKTKLTLMQIRKLRKMIDVRAYEKSQELKQIRRQYMPPTQSNL